jgi:hypothetical protein
VKPVKAITPAKTSNKFHRIDGPGAFLANSNEFLHGFRLLVAPAEIPLANGFPHEFRNRSLLAPCAGVESIPDLIVQVELGPPHDV